MLAPPYAIPDDGSLQLVLPDFYAERSYWLAAPTDLYRLQRVRAVWNLLREHAESHRHLFMHALSEKAAV
jgi:DNA-binding transcriptional LysR family regulator